MKGAFLIYYSFNYSFILKDVILILTQFSLVMSRIVPIIYLTPFLGAKIALSVIKIGFAMLISLLLYPSLHPSMANIDYYSLTFIALLIKEIWIGFIIGFIAQLPFYAFEALGYSIDTFRNAIVTGILDSYYQQETSLLGEFYFQLSIVIFFLINGHQYFLLALADSYTNISINAFPAFGGINKIMLYKIIKEVGRIIIISLRLSAPVLLVMFLIDILSSLLNRISPYFNAFFYSLSIKAAVGLLICFLTYNFIIKKIAYELMNSIELVFNIIQ